MTTPAPGARVIVRDAEWLVRSIKRASNGAQVFEAVGISDFIKGKVGQFVSELETDLTVLDPKDTALVTDDSSGYQKSLLFIESHLRQTAPTDANLYVGHQAVMDVLPFQLDPALKALKMPRQRLLIADAVGLGKTLEAGILVSELIRRGRARRILVVTTKSMLIQFQKEFWTRFTIPLVRLDSIGLQRIRTRIPGNHNPFHYYDRAIVSVDTLKQDREYRTYIETADWDVIVIDECHNVARRGRGRGGGSSLRSQLAARLSTRSDALILLSATPHDGRPESFASLMNMLDPTAIANESHYSKEHIRDLYLRRFKKDVADQLSKHFPERQVQAQEALASPAEERAFDQLNQMTLAKIDAQGQAGNLFKTTLLKSLLSSPMACLQTLQSRLRNLERQSPGSPGKDYGTDLAELGQLEAVVTAITPENFAKYQTLLQLITGEDNGSFNWHGQDSRDRLVIFTERLETMNFLAKQLQQDLKLPPAAIATLEGGMADVEQMQVIEAFGQDRAPLRLLIATDVASEGINLHYLCHRLIHFDIPWSLMVLQQRNGRIDRYGQEQQPQIRYLLSRSQHPKMDEVERIIRVLLDKDEQAVRNIGDPSAFMGVFDVDEEIRITATAIEQGQSSEEFDRQLTPQPQSDDFDPFALFDQDPEVSQPDSAQVATKTWPSLFETNFSYVSSALEVMAQSEALQINRVPHQQLIELTMPAELRQRYSRLPREIVPAADQPLVLCANQQAITTALENARRQEESWPAMQYLWELHPIMGWLNDRGMTSFGRHQAPLVALPQHLADQEVVFIMAGVIPNRRGQPLINHWLSVVFQDGQVQRVETFAQTLARTHLGKRPIPNPGQPVDQGLLALRSLAVDQAIKALLEERQAFMAQLEPQLQQQRQRLADLRGRHYEQLELRFKDENLAGPSIQTRKDKERARIERMFADLERWVEASMTTEPAPYIKIIAVLRGSQG